MDRHSAREVCKAMERLRATPCCYPLERAPARATSRAGSTWQSKWWNALPQRIFPLAIIPPYGYNCLQNELRAEGKHMRRTKIVCTIGPASNSEEKLEQLMRAGMNVARLNFSHGTHDEHALVIERVRAIAARLGCSIAILQDLQGPKIRTGALQGGQPVRLLDGAALTVTTRPVVGDAQVVSTTYQQLPEDIKPGDRILLDDGSIELCALG